MAAQAEAQKECPAGTTAEPVDTDYILNYCPLLLPAHATFVCAPARKSAGYSAALLEAAGLFGRLPHETGDFHRGRITVAGIGR